MDDTESSTDGTDDGDFEIGAERVSACTFAFAYAGIVVDDDVWVGDERDVAWTDGAGAVYLATASTSAASTTTATGSGSIAYKVVCATSSSASSALAGSSSSSTAATPSAASPFTAATVLTSSFAWSIPKSGP